MVFGGGNSSKDLKKENSSWLVMETERALPLANPEEVTQLIVKVLDKANGEKI